MEPYQNLQEELPSSTTEFERDTRFQEGPSAQPQETNEQAAIQAQSSFLVNTPVQSTVVSEPIDAFEQPMNATKAREISSKLIHSYFTTQFNPLTRHHIESYDQFLQTDLTNIITSHNPIIVLKNHKADRDKVGAEGKYKYKAEIFIGGETGKEIFIGTPTVMLEQGNDVRLLFPNEARLRNLTYSVQIEATVLVRVSVSVPRTEQNPRGVDEYTETFRIPLFSMPLMLHSNYCMLHGKPASLITQMGECPQDQGGYFIIEGSEKVLVTRQEGAFNTLWISEKQRDPNIQYRAMISSLNTKSREVKNVNFYWTRDVTRKSFGKEAILYKPSVLEVSIPFVLKPLPIFVLFRALGLQSDREIIQLIFPDLESPEAKLLSDLLIPSINAAKPFVDTYTSVQYIKSLIKGFSEFHVLDVLHNHLFPHVEDLPGARVTFLADCVRKILRVVKKIDEPLSRDDTRYQRLLTSGFLCQLQFKNVYAQYVKMVKQKGVDEKFNYNESVYSNQDFIKIFSEANRKSVFHFGFISQSIMRGFKGKWKTGPEKEEAGLLQELSRLSFLDFTSHLRRAVLNFNSGMKLAGPRRLNPSQYGYFCTSETPSGAHIGVTKNLSIMTAISTSSPTESFIEWLFTRGGIIPCEFMTPELMANMIPVYVNSGIVGYTKDAKTLSRVLRYFKRAGFLPPLSSSGYSIPERRVFVFFDEGRPLRPLIICQETGILPSPDLFNRGSWRDYIVGLIRKDTPIGSREFVDPLADHQGVTLAKYIEVFEAQKDKLALIEYVDPFEQNELLLANYPEHVTKQTTHMEVHPSTILGLLGNMIPYPNHNQSPRNQLSASQSKQGLSLYATNWYNRFDNTANVLCYGQAPLVRTIYQDYIGDGRMPYGQNIILAMGMYGGYNQEDGIIMNADALARGQFRSLNYRSYEAFEEDDKEAHTKIRIGNPKQIPGWVKLKPFLNYTKLDDSGIIRPGEYVDQNTVIVGRYMMGEKGSAMTDVSVTPQVWTRGRVESVVLTVNNSGFRLVKIRVVQDRVPELGDKFSNRHGQKGTINVLYRAHDMPRTADGIVPDMIMNPTAIPSRMTIGQILEMMMGNVAAELGAIGNCTAFMNDGSPHPILGNILESMGLNKMCNQVLYNGMTGEQMTADIYMGVVYAMRLKHMTEDKWNARGKGRKEQRTHQPTGGRGNEGGLKIGEMERDAICAHGIATFVQESYMARSDGEKFIICNGCGSIPLYNERQGFYLCTMCDGPIQFSGDNATNLNPIPPATRSATTFSTVEMPYVTKLFFQEMETYMNMGFRLLTTRDVARLKGLDTVEEMTAANMANLAQPLPELEYPDDALPELPAVNLPAPTAYNVAKQIQTLRAEAAAINQSSQQQQPPTNQLPGNSVIPVFTNFTAPQQPVSQQKQQFATPQADIQLQPGSFSAAPAIEGAVIATTDTGQPIINISTDEQTLSESGLVQPRQTAAVPPPQTGFAPPTARRIRRPVVPPPVPAQEGGYDGGYGDEQDEQEEQYQRHMPMNSSQSLKVVKLG